MTWEGLEDLTPSNGAIQSLKDLIIAELFTDPELKQFFTLRQNVHNGDKLGYVRRGFSYMRGRRRGHSGCGRSVKHAACAVRAIINVNKTSEVTYVIEKLYRGGSNADIDNLSSSTSDAIKTFVETYGDYIGNI